MQTRKSLRFLLSLCLVFAMLLIPAAATGETETTPVAAIGDVEYPTLQDALDAAGEGDTITLLSDVVLVGTVQLDDTIHNAVYGDGSGESSDPADGSSFYAPYQKPITSYNVLMGSEATAADVTLNGSYTGAKASVLTGQLTVTDGAGLYGTDADVPAWRNVNVNGGYSFAVGDLLVYETDDYFAVTYSGETPIAQLDLEAGAEMARFGHIYVGSDQHDKGENAYVMNIPAGAVLKEFAQLTTRGDGTINVAGTIDSFTDKSWQSSSAAATSMFENAKNGGHNNNNGVINVAETGSIRIDSMNIGRKQAYGEAELNIDGGTVEFRKYINVGYDSSARQGVLNMSNGATLISRESSYTLQYNNGNTTGIEEMTQPAGTLTIGSAASGVLNLSADCAVSVGSITLGDLGKISIDASGFSDTDAHTVIEQTNEDAESLEGKVEINNLPAGYLVSYADGDVTIAPAVAKVGDAEFTTLQEALDAAGEGDTVTLLSDIELTAQGAQEYFKPVYNRESYAGLIIPDDKAVAIDLNGKTVSYVDTYGDLDNVMVLNLGNLTINDTVGGGKLTYKPVAGATTYTYFYSTIFNCGTLTVNGGTIENTAGAATDVTNAVDNHSRLSHEYGNDCILTVNGGTLIGSEYRAIRQYTHYYAGVKNRVTIHDGTIMGGIYMQHGDSWYYTEGANNNRAAVDCQLTIAGGTITSIQSADGSNYGHVRMSLNNPDNPNFILEINGGTIEVPVQLRIQKGYRYSEDGSATSGTLIKGNGAGTSNADWLAENGGFIRGGTFYVVYDSSYAAENNTVETRIAGSGTEADPYVIDSADELNYFRDSVNSGENYSGRYVKLDTNIDLNNKLWTPIGNTTYTDDYVPADTTKVFGGVFDGNGMTISNLKIEKDLEGTDPDADATIGLFGITGEGAVIKDLTITNVDIDATGRNVGALVGFAYKTTLDNITVNGGIQIIAGNNVSGVCAMSRYADFSATNITVKGDAGSLIKGNNIVGGVFAEIAPNGSKQTLSNLSVENVAIEGVGGVGGVVGLLTAGEMSDVTVKDVSLVGKTTWKETEDRIRLGSVAGLLGSTTATISDAVIENVTAKNLEGEAVVLPVIGANYSGSIGNATEARIGDKYYATLTRAIAAAATGDTITLLSDITLTAPVTVAADDVIVLDLNGKTISQTVEQSAAYSMIVNNGTLTIQDSVGGGRISYTDSGTTSVCNYVSNTVQNNGTLTVAGGTIENLSSATVASNGYPHAIDTNGALYITGGTVVNEEYSAIRIWCTTDDNTLVSVTGGTVRGAIDLHNVSSSANRGVLTVSGNAVLECNEANAAAIRFLAFGDDVDEFSATITGGTVKGTVIVRNFCGADDSIFDGVYSITGGTFTSELDAAYLAEGCAAFPVVGGYEVKELNESTAAAKIGDKLFTTITAAINAAPDGGTVYVYPGTYDEAIAPWSNDYTHKSEKSVTLLGAVEWCEGGETILTGGMYLGYDDAKTREHAITVKGFTFQNKGLTIADQKTVIIENNTFADIEGRAILVMDQFRSGAEGSAIIAGNVITNATTGIEVRRPHDAHIINNQITNTADNTILVSGSANADKGEAFGTVEISGNELANWGMGGEGRAIRITGAELLIITGNTLTNENAPEEFIKVGDSLTAESAIRIFDNKMPENASVLVKGLVAETADGTGYTSLQTAIEAAEAKDVITLLNDITLTEGVTVAADKILILELNGKTVSMSVAATETSALITNKGDLTIQDSVGGGKLTYVSSTVNTSYSTSTVNNSGVLTVESGTVVNTSARGGAAYAIDSYNTLTVNGGLITSTKTNAIRQAQFGNYDNIVAITGGTVSGGYAGLQIHCFSAAKTTKTVIDGGTVSGGTYAFYSYFYKAEDSANTSVEINGGTFNGYVFLYSAINGSNTAPFTASVTDGVFNSEVYFYTKDADGNEVYLSGVITGGNFSAEPAEVYIAADHHVYLLPTERYLVTDLTVETAAVVLNGEVPFADLASALDAAAFGETSTIVVKEQQYLTEAVHINNRTIILSGNVSCSANQCIIVDSGAELVLEDAAVSGTIEGVYVQGGGKLAVNSGKIEAPDAVYLEGGAELVVNGGILSATNVAIKAMYEAEVTITGGEISGNYRDIDANEDAVVSISGGEFAWQIDHAYLTEDCIYEAWDSSKNTYSYHKDNKQVFGAAIGSTVTNLKDPDAPVSYWIGKTYILEGSKASHVISGGVHETDFTVYTLCSVGDSSPVDLFTAEKPGYDFIGWKNADGGVVTEYVVTGEETEPIVFTAVFTPTITDQPTDATIYVGEQAKFSVVAALSDQLTYQWERFVDGEWKNVFETNETGKTPNFVASAVEQAMKLQLRCKVSDAEGSTAYSDEVTLTVKPYVATVGDQQYKTLAEAIEALIAQKADHIILTADVNEEPIVITQKIGFTMNHGTWDFDPFAAIVPGEGWSRSLSGSPYEDYVCAYSFYPTAPVIDTQPTDQTVLKNEVVRFETGVTGEGYTYKWQERKVGGDWTDLAATTSYLKVTATAARDGAEYRCIITTPQGGQTISDVVTLTLTKSSINITTQPKDLSGLKNEIARFEIGVAGDGLTYKWQERKVGGDWTDLAATTSYLKITVTAARDGAEYRCIITDANGFTETTDTVTLTMTKSSIEITSQPEDLSGLKNEVVRFEIGATGDGLTYKWQERKIGGDWTDLAATTSYLKITVTAARDGAEYRCTITDANSFTETTDTVTLTMVVPKSSIEITSQPKDLSGENKEVVRFEIGVTGDGLTYKWQERKIGGDWTDLAATTSYLKITVTAARDGAEYRCTITDANGFAETTNTVTLTMEKAVSSIVINQQPTSLTGTLGEILRFEIGASGNGLTYKWQERRVGGDWTDLAATTRYLKITLTASRNGAEYRCIITDVGGFTETTDTVTMSVDAPESSITILVHPSDVESILKNIVIFEVEAEGDGLTYQWQERRVGGDWTNIGSNNRTQKVTATATRDGAEYRCVITDANGASETTDTATLSIVEPVSIEIYSQPENASAALKEVVTFSVSAESSDGLTLSYQWQERRAGGEWTNLGSNKSSLNVTATVTRADAEYRCIVTDTDGNEVTSDAATLSVQ